MMLSDIVNPLQVSASAAQNVTVGNNNHKTSFK